MSGNTAERAQEITASYRTVHDDGTEEWRTEDGILHRADGPAKIRANGTQGYFHLGRCHRDDGPAVIWANGIREFFLHGARHRDDGPAIEYPTGDGVWFRHGAEYTPTNDEVFAWLASTMNLGPTSAFRR